MSPSLPSSPSPSPPASGSSLRALRFVHRILTPPWMSPLLIASFLMALSLSVIVRADGAGPAMSAEKS
jgi:hypothetical protein